MFAFSHLPASIPNLLAADNRVLKVDLGTIGDENFQISGLALLVLGLILVSFAIGIWFANQVRMKDYGWKIGLILATLTASLAISLFGSYKLGVDLQGGVILVYDVNEEETKQLATQGGREGIDINGLVTVLRDRLNETGLKEIVVRPFGPKQVEIVVPEVDEEEIRKLKERIITGGTLQFMIVANEIKNSDIFEAAKEQAQSPDPEIRGRRPVLNDDGEQIGFWAKMGREKSATSPETAPFRDSSIVQNGFIRDARTGEIITLSTEQRFAFANPGNHAAFQSFLAAREIKDIDALMVFDPDYTIRGSTDLGPSSMGNDPQNNFAPMILFSTKGEGEFKMGNLTARNVQRKMAIIFDNVVQSAPVINEKITKNGQITGSFTSEEVKFMVDILNSGSLPVVLHEKPLSENTIGAILGLDTIKKGSWSVVIALGLVLLFLIAYYRFAGLVASFALTLNLLLTVAFMVVFQAPFTLPGLAGLVLTVAMSVDANVLISERIREELARGATLRMAIRNGFDKALSAIIDGNLTTFMTALILYVIGTDQIRGFGMTLMLGNVTSMFTAIFCARVIFDVAERTRWVQTLSMASILTAPKVDWVRYFVPGVVASLILFVIGLGATVARGKGLFDTDLAGGTSVAFILKEPTEEEDVREKLDKVFATLIDETTKARVDHNVYSMSVETERPKTVYKIDSSLEDIDLLKEKVREALRGPDGQEGLRTFQLDIGAITQRKYEPAAVLEAAGTPGDATPPASTPTTTQPPPPLPPATVPSTDEVKPATEKPATDQPADEKPAEEKSGEEKAEEPNSDSSGCQEESAAEKAEADKTDADKPAPETAAPAAPETADLDKPAEAAPSTPATTPSATSPPATSPPLSLPPATADERAASAAPPQPEFESTATLTFPKSPITAAALRDHLRASASAVLGRNIAILDVDNPGWNRKDNSAFEQWTVRLGLGKDEAAKVLGHMREQVEKNVVWQTSSKIGGQVSEDTRWRALGALAVSLLVIVAYVWFRFHKPAWGLAAVAALAHDALSMLTAIALSYWFAGSLGFLGVEEFKISLPVVAAFLTILGYSVNDTIVIFDRLREIRGKSPEVTREMLNDAVNQTLSRTIILAGITLTVTGVLYFFGGPGIHGFAFALLIGVISGCYTTLIIAAPLLYWLLGRKAPAAAKVEPARSGMAKSA
jgi:SecD/SecF fusion protein